MLSGQPQGCKNTPGKLCLSIVYSYPRAQNTQDLTRRAM